MSLSKQIHIYSVDTSSFYHDDEMKIHKRLSKAYTLRNEIKERISDETSKYNKLNKGNEILDISELEISPKLKKQYANINKFLKQIKNKLYLKFKENKGKVRHLNKNSLNKYNIVSVFDSALTRTIKIPENTLSEDIIIVQTYFFDVIEDIILNGFLNYNNEKYICLTASAGQIRTKKTVFIKENIWNEHKNTITCGLSADEINNRGGVNINKYLAYLALCNSATDVWEGFDINKSIVVEDFETEVDGIVDLIDDETYTIKEKTYMKIPIPHTDGCGMILPKKSKKNMMIRLPWVKGLLVSFPYDVFIKEKSEELGYNCGIVKDIYGVEHDILKEEIEVIFTKSQFKMYKFYDNWRQYIDNFNKYNCHAGKCNEEESKFSYAKLNYQMLQTLSDMTDGEIKKIAQETIDDINNIGSDKKIMLKVLGVKESNSNKNYMQQALDEYDLLLNDSYNKEILKQVKKSMVKEARAAKLNINGMYTFISPDLYAFCEYLFLGIKEPQGLLKDMEVCCSLFKNEPKLDCLRSPHLYREHAIRNNIVDEEKGKWFITKALYTSCHDMISKVLQFDVDGDKALVCADKTIINVAERNMKDIVPLYYNMKKAKPTNINKDTIYEGLKLAYTGGNIGGKSNDITKVWDNENRNLDIIKLLCMETNFTIDYAKTLYKPTRPNFVNKLITDYTKLKTPHFFIYAKDKTKNKVEKINNSVVNKLEKIIPNPRIKFKQIHLDKFDYTKLMKNKSVILDKDNEEIIKKYIELDLKKHFMISTSEDDDHNNIYYLYQDIKRQILEINNDIHYVTDVLVEYLYNHKKARLKTTLWECFGDIIVENIKQNTKNDSRLDDIKCEKCNTLIKQTNNKIKYCNECAKKINKEKTKENMRNKRKCLK